MKFKAPYRLIIPSIALFLLSACSHYEAVDRTTSLKHFELAPVVNNTSATQIIIPLQRELRTQFLEAGIDLTSNPSGTLQITITDFEREAISRDPSDTGKPLSFRLILAAQVSWDSNGELPPWGSQVRTFIIEKSIFANPSLISAEAQVIPIMAEELANQIADLILYSW